MIKNSLGINDNKGEKKTKKLFALIMILMMSVCIVACNNDSTNATTGESANDENGAWSTSLSVDEFGDVTDDSETLLTYPINGTFSNTATEEDELGGNLCFRRHPNKLHYVMEICLKEYGDTPVTFYENDSIVLKTKINDAISEYKLDGEAPDGNLYLGINPEMTGGETGADALLNTLYNGNDVRCIIEINSSQYNFTIESVGFDKVCKENDFLPTQDKDFFKVVMGIDDPVKQVLQIGLELMENNFTNQELYNAILNSYLNTDALLTTEEIKEKIKGSMLQFDIIEANDLGYSISSFREDHPEVNPSGKSYTNVESNKYSEDMYHSFGFMQSPSRDVGISSFDSSCSFFGEEQFLTSGDHNDTINIKDNKMTFIGSGYEYDRYFNEVEDGVYLFLNENYNIEGIWFACDEDITSKEQIIEQLEKKISDR